MLQSCIIIKTGRPKKSTWKRTQESVLPTVFGGGSDPKSVIGNSLYYPAGVGSRNRALPAGFCHQQINRGLFLIRRSCWLEMDNEGWFRGLSSLGEDTYVVLHSGDMTMGGDSIYRLAGNSLVDVGGAKYLSSLAQGRDQAVLYQPGWPWG